jgi:cytochrome c-type biogenesis protein
MSYEIIIIIVEYRINIKAILHSLFFVLGFSLVFISLGVLAGIFPAFLYTYKRVLTLLGGVVIIFFGLHLAGIIRIFALEREVRFNTAFLRAGLLRSFLVGVGFSAGWTPCIGPILASMFALSAGTSENVLQSVILFIFFSLGIGIPFLLSAGLIGLFFEFFKKFKRAIKFVEVLAGVILIVIGILLLTDTLVVINNKLLTFAVENSLEKTILKKHGLSYGIAFFGGLLAFLSPCILPLVPSYVAYITGVSVEDVKQEG